MSHPFKKIAQAGAAATVVSAVLGAGVANAQYYPYAPPRAYYGAVGPADPCARTAAERRLGWGIVGLIAGGLAGGAVAAAGVTAEGAALGAFVGSIIGGRAGYRSAACGTAAYAYYPPPPPAYPGYYGHPTYGYPGPQPVSYYQQGGAYGGGGCCAQPGDYGGGYPPPPAYGRPY